jgi:hypothetical protein
MSFLDDVSAVGEGGGPPGGDKDAQLAAQWNKLRESFSSVAPLLQELLDGRGLPSDNTVRKNLREIGRERDVRSLVV